MKFADNQFSGQADRTPHAREEGIASPRGCMPEDFVDGAGRCASLSVLLHVLSVIESTEPLDASQGIIHHLCVLAGTIGFPGLDDAPYRAESAVERSASLARQEAGSDKSAA